MKDYNDLLLNGYDIKSLNTIPLDMMALSISLDNASDRQAEYRTASNFCKTVKDGMIKSDIASMLSKRWNKDISEVKSYINARANDNDTLLQKMHGFDDCWIDMKKFINEEGSGLGFPSLDYSMGGVKRREVVLLGAYTNNGKSFLAAKIAAHRILNYNDNVMIFSMEMPRGQFILDIILEILQTNEFSLKKMLKTKEGAELFDKVKSKLEKKIIIVDEPGKSIHDLWKFTEIAQANDFNVDFVIFDHFHLIPNVDDISVLKDNADLMKSYVKHFNLRLLTLCQFNEESQRLSYGKKKALEPTVNNIKGANDLKAIADTVLLVWRPYNTDTGLDPIERESIKYITRIKIGKLRRKIRGDIVFNLKFEPTTNALEEVSSKDMQV